MLRFWAFATLIFSSFSLNANDFVQAQSGFFCSPMTGYIQPMQAESPLPVGLKLRNQIYAVLQTGSGEVVFQKLRDNLYLAVNPSVKWSSMMGWETLQGSISQPGMSFLLYLDPRGRTQESVIKLYRLSRQEGLRMNWHILSFGPISVNWSAYQFLGEGRILSGCR